MFRKIVCTLFAGGLVLFICAPVHAAGSSGFEEGMRLVIQAESGPGSFPFKPYYTPPSTDMGQVRFYHPEITVVAESPKTGDYPAPIFAAMGLSLGVVFLLILTENRMK